MSASMLDMIAPEAPVGYQIIVRRDGMRMAEIDQMDGQWCLRILADDTALFCGSAIEALEAYYVHAECGTR
jgi:hypothetical protein